MRTLAAAAAAATVLGVALLVAADGAAASMSWGLAQNVIVALALVGVGNLLARRPEGRRIGLLLLVTGTAMALSLMAGGWAAVDGPGGELVGWAADGWLWAFSVVPLTTVLFAVFPDGRAPTPRWRPVVWLGWAATLGLAVGSAVGSDMLAAAAGGVMWTAAGIGGLAALAVRWHGAQGIARQQLKYLLLAGLLVLILYSVADVLPYHVRQAAFLAIPLLLLGAVALAVVRYRLYDIDLVIRRTTVFVGVAVLVFATYLGVAAAFGATRSERAALIAAVVVAAVAEPARRRLSRATTRLLFGHRDEPLAALALLRDRLRDAADDAQLGASVTTAVTRLMRTRTVALYLLADGEIREAARVGEPDHEAVQLPLVHQSELLGRLAVGLRQPGVPFGRDDMLLLIELSHQVAAAAHAVRLRAELRLVADRAQRAAAVERERLHRDLHDRLGPILVGTGLAVDGLRRSADDLGDAARGLDEIAAQLRAASGEVRRIIDRIQPAALLQLGLLDAVREHLQRLGRLPEAPSFTLLGHDVQRLPPVVAEAAYFLVLEAVTNVVRHASATRATVRFVRAGDVLAVEVTDDGAGLPQPYVAGVGIGSMRRRALEAGGTCTVEPGPERGTRVRAEFRLEEALWPTPAPSESSSPTTIPSSVSVCAASSTPFPASKSSVKPPMARRSSPQPSS
ncbi:sensor histidine kinase [Blastococcus mobilis]|uniref:histidine kinase n=1 Tax=Blastococcus mobilis TaxID=1938746 RepID=A0A238Z918_9ACTN|nr:ATP-binding protein [Blastococcus mobilis]SNR80005.1 Histidine kinase-, DNA gyrase B-, and HSP90-like ATPase [Blastococcus mobilis]